ncbi:ArsB/NhaD family transporter [Rubrobacter marinus]|nr:ArsB/NhaD family transporter [Rubrobacter marinus]
MEGVGLMEAVFAVALFVVVLVLVGTEVVNRTVAALLGAAVVISFGIVEQSEAATEFIDWNTIGLLAGMMVIVAVLDKTGLFEYLAIKSARWGKARPGRILILLAVVTAVLSAFLDNVTTVILMVPVTFLIADALGVSPLPFMLTQVIASNIGGAATLIGDPPNILIGSAAGLTFADFVFNLAPVVVLTLPFVLLYLYLVFRRELKASEASEETVMGLDARGAIRDPVLLRKCLIVLGAVILGFFLHGTLHLEAATIALFGAAVLLLYARSNVEEVLREVEWPTLFFFVGLFVLVGGLEATGVVGGIAEMLTAFDATSATAAVVILWGSGIASGVIDNIPFTATMIPVLQELGESEGLTEAQIRPLWWSLALGADFGGNATLIAASANVVVAGMSERAGQRISFVKFLVYGIPVTLISLVIATVYVLVRYY